MIVTMPTLSYVRVVTDTGARQLWEIRGPDGYVEFIAGTHAEMADRIGALERKTGQQYAAREA